MNKRYTVFVRRVVEKELEAMDSALSSRLERAILSLENTPRPIGCKRLKGRNSYRIRCGSYRVLYDVDDALREVDVFAVGHRREVYRGF